MYNDSCQPARPVEVDMTRVSRFRQFATTLIYSSCALWMLAPLSLMAQTTEGVNPEAVAADPMLVKRLRRLRATRQRARSARRLGIDV